MSHPQLVDVFSSPPFIEGDEGAQRLMVKPLAAVPPVTPQQPTAVPATPYPGGGNPYSVVSRQETILAMNQREQVPHLPAPSLAFPSLPSVCLAYRALRCAP